MDIGNLQASYLLGGSVLVAAGTLALVLAAWGLCEMLAAWRER